MHEDGGEPMIQTIEATIDEQGIVRLLQPVRVPVARRASELRDQSGRRPAVAV